MQRLSLKEQEDILNKLIKENPDATVGEFWEIINELQEIIKSRYEYHNARNSKFGSNSKGNENATGSIF